MDAATVMHSTRRQASAIAPHSGLRTAFHCTGERRFSGFVFDASNPAKKFVVEIFVDGYPIRVVRADNYVHELLQQQIGDGHYGFSCVLDQSVVRDNSVIEARLANLGTIVGMPRALLGSSKQGYAHFKPGSVRWLGGLRFSGWMS